MRVHYVVAVILFAAATVAWAGKKSSRNVSMEFDTADTLNIGHTQLKPGHYTFDANETGTELEVLRDDKIVATAACHWVRLPNKAENSEILSNHGRVMEIEFEGRSEAVKLG